jgi:hypothetical protein
MRLFPLPCCAVLACALTLAAAQTAIAGPEDYQFQVVEPAFRQGEQVPLTIAITDLRTKTAVEDGTIIAAQMDMSPDGMTGMSGQVMPVGTSAPGRYGLVANLAMAGNWRLAIAVRLPGEAEVIWREVTVKVAP